MDARTDVSVCFRFHRDGKNQRKSLDVADGLTDGSGPEGDDGNSSTNAAQVAFHFHQRTKLIFLREILGNLKYVVFAPADASAVERPHVVRRSVRIGKRGVEAMTVQINGVQLYFSLAGIANRGGDQCNARKLVVHLDNECFLQVYGSILSGDFDTPSYRSKSAVRRGNLGVRYVEHDVWRLFSVNGNFHTGIVSRIVERKLLVTGI